VSVSPPTVAPISPGEMQLLLSRAGLMLNPGQVADLVLAWRQVASLIGTLPRDRPVADDMALTFRLPPPTGTRAAAPAAAPPKASARPKKAPAPAPRAAKPKKKAAPAKKKGAAKRPAAKSASRKKVRRGR
jgi:hypothetical protein